MDSTVNESISVKLDIPVTSLSVSPLGNEVVLAAKRGLYIVNLNKPFQPPAILHHLTKWEVVDVQWCPHKSHAHWIASTSNQKALIWNTDLVGNNQVQFVLGKHTRSVSDMHWSPFTPSLLSTCSYDAMIHLWDLREKTEKPVQSFSAWTLGVSQVKFNRLNEFLLASAHDTDVRIWDLRKGSSPVGLITAHGMKISGIDWSHRNERQLLTCSQDKSVKFWDVLYPRICQAALLTNSPVYRARFTPFGAGVVTMPQRKDNNLYLYSLNNLTTPLASFTGHIDTPIEFVWRFIGNKSESEDDREFQLVTWSKDHHLRMWPIGQELYKGVDHTLSSRNTSIVKPALEFNAEIKSVLDSFSANVESRTFIFSVDLDDQETISLQVTLPWDYPRASPSFEIIGKDIPLMMDKLNQIAALHLEHGEPCLHAGFESLFAPTLLDSPNVGTMEIMSDSDSSEGYQLTNDKSPTNGPNVNVPYPRLCGASFSVGGRMVCFKSLLPHPSSGGFSDPLREDKCQPRTLPMFERYLNYLGNMSSPLKREGSRTDRDSIEKRKPLFESPLLADLPRSSIPVSFTSHGSSDVESHFQPLQNEKASHLDYLRRQSIASASSSLDRDSDAQLGVHSEDLDASTNEPRIQLNDFSPKMPRARLASTDIAFKPHLEPLRRFRSVSGLTHDGSPLNDSDTLNPFNQRSRVAMLDYSMIVGIDLELASHYKVTGSDPVDLASFNEGICRIRGRTELAEVWNVLKIVLHLCSSNPLVEFAQRVYTSLLDYLETKGDIQTLVCLTAISKHLWIKHSVEEPVIILPVEQLFLPKRSTFSGTNLVSLGRMSASPMPEEGFSSYHSRISSRRSTQGLDKKFSGWDISKVGLGDAKITLMKPKLEHEGLASLSVDLTSFQARISAYQTLYADILLAWDLNLDRLKLAQQVPGQEDEILVATGFACPICLNEMIELQKDEYGCRVCQVQETPLLSCGVCRLPFPKSTLVCTVCSHGGHRDHIKEWFAQNPVCPTGCGCHCTENMGKVRFIEHESRYT